jgi:GntR family transcriptional regulator/MocR family aminotransferase
MPRTSIVLHLDEDSPLTLQGQIRQKLVDAIASGSMPTGTRLPSSRILARQLGVARNTVVLACQQLIAEGILTGRERSGIFVDDALPDRPGRVAAGARPPPSPWGGFAWTERLEPGVPDIDSTAPPADWSRYPYPFIDGVFDRSLLPVAEWREASRMSLGVRDIDYWAGRDPDLDDPDFLARLRDLLLQRYGIHAELDEILVTCSVRAALFLAVSLVARGGRPVAVENPGNPLVRRLLTHLGAEIRPQPVDEDGMVVDEGLAGCRSVIVSPTFHFPTNATMPAVRRRDLLARARDNDMSVIEFDADGELAPPHEALPTLRGLDRDGRVVRVAGLNALMGPALRLGLLIAPSPVIAQARKLRALIGAAPAPRDQRACLYFLALGHYEAAMARVGRALQARRTAIADALDHYLPQSVTMLPLRNGTAAWIRGPHGIDARALAAEAARRGILIEPAAPCFAGQDGQSGLFRMSLTSLPIERIRPGVAALAEVVRDHLGGTIEHLDMARNGWMSGGDIAARLAGASFLCRTLYDTPLTVTLGADGSMTGVAGAAGEDRDTGLWWIDGDRWMRRWTRWNYGEALGFYCVIAGTEIKWFNGDGRLVDRAAIVWDTPVENAAPVQLHLQ